MNSESPNLLKMLPIAKQSKNLSTLEWATVCDQLSLFSDENKCRIQINEACVWKEKKERVGDWKWEVEGAVYPSVSISAHFS